MLRDSKIWVAVTAYNPLDRAECLLSALEQYVEYEASVDVTIYVNDEAQDDVDQLEQLLDALRPKLNIKVKVAGPEYSGWALTWAHKTDLVLACMNYKYDYYIYQENDMLLTWENFKYWVRWRPRLAAYGLEPGFIRYEDLEGEKIPFDNHYKYKLTGTTPNVWSDRGFDVPVILVIDHEIEFFVQVANPYYGAMILDSPGAVKYVKSWSMDPQASCFLVSYRNWPLADRSSMGLAFENVPKPYEHTRCVAVASKDHHYVPYAGSLIEHKDTKYSTQLAAKSEPLITCNTMFEV